MTQQFRDPFLSGNEESVPPRRFEPLHEGRRTGMTVLPSGKTRIVVATTFDRPSSESVLHERCLEGTERQFHFHRIGPFHDDSYLPARSDTGSERSASW